MKKGITISLFIIVMIVSFTVPRTVGENQVSQLGPDTVESQGLIGVPPVQTLNASITKENRNITISATSELELIDEITLEIHDNDTFISALNYTLPSSFAKHIDQVNFFVKRGNSVGLKNDQKFRKDFTVYSGFDATTYTIPLVQNGSLANSTESINVYAKILAMDAIQYDSVNGNQQGTFVAPVRPVFNNLRVDNDLIGVRLSTDSDDFNITAMNKIKVKGIEYPKLPSLKLLEWINISRPAYQPEENLVEDYDFTKVVFVSQTPKGASDQSGLAIVPFVISNAERDLKIDPWGFVYVTETMTVLHTGASRSGENINLVHQILGIAIGLDEAATVTDLYDEFGKLNIGQLKDNKPDTQLIDGRKSLGITFRNPIYGGEEYKFTVKYFMNATDVISDEKNVIGSSNLFSMNTTIFSLVNTTILKLRSSFELPAGATLQSNGFHPGSHQSIYSISTTKNRDTLSYFSHLQLNIFGENVRSHDIYEFQITYTYNGTGHFQYIFTLILTLIVVLFTILGISKIPKGEGGTVGEQTEKLPIDEIDAFLKYFTEHNDAYNTIADLAAKRRKNKLSQKEYSTTVKTIRKRIRDNNKKLAQSIKELSSKGGRYERLVSKIMVSSEKINGLRSNISNQRNSFAKKQIAKDIYRKTVKEYRNEIDKHKSTINKSISELNDVINLN